MRDRTGVTTSSARLGRLWLLILLLAAMLIGTAKTVAGQPTACAQPAPSGCPFTTQPDISWSGATKTVSLASTSRPDWWTVSVPPGFGISVALLSLDEDYDLAVRSPDGALHVSAAENDTSEHVI